MFWSVFWASAHYLGILVLFGCVYGMLLFWRTQINEYNFRTLLWLHVAYWVSLLVVLVSGLARAGWTEKGMVFYMANPWFHAKVTVFVLIILLSLYPVKLMRAWRRTADGEAVPPVSFALQKSLRRTLVAEIHLISLMPILGALMARGVGM
ncbi:hypothetical protein Y5S_00784 [Alcanivorax nanhaiticus]|uniref:DUF2214 domain-containing protein n=1 Tax=Alcanivorax nanhaiticus TaxID=1177154 RepID=A0A095SNZ5_9GAMM|nr:DUF2214 family protein [Alcanivorax nanhaiticus]KGD66312.1 hypothetical protein Y5S_00784 [Alcanivorax nanhaiticus]